MGESQTEIDFVLIKKEHRRFIQNKEGSVEDMY